MKEKYKSGDTVYVEHGTCMAFDTIIRSSVGTLVRVSPSGGWVIDFANLPVACRLDVADFRKVSKETDPELFI